MTKKAWQDWQERVNETTNITLYKPLIKRYNEGNVWAYILFTDKYDGKLMKITFNGDFVEIIIERIKDVIKGSTIKQYYTVIEHITLNREDIKNVVYKNK